MRPLFFFILFACSCWAHGQTMPAEFVQLRDKIAAIRDSIDSAVRARMTPLDKPSWPYLTEHLQWSDLKGYELLWVEYNYWASAEERTNEVHDMSDRAEHSFYYHQLKQGVALMGKVRKNDTAPIWMAQIFDDRYIVVSSQSMDTPLPHFYSYYLVRKAKR